MTRELEGIIRAFTLHMQRIAKQVMSTISAQLLAMPKGCRAEELELSPMLSAREANFENIQAEHNVKQQLSQSLHQKSVCSFAYLDAYASLIVHQHI